MNKYTSLSLSKKLAEGGCKIECEYMWVKYELWDKPKLWRSDIGKDVRIECLSGKREFEIPAYDLLWDICVKHREAFFGETLFNGIGISYPAFWKPKRIMMFLQINKIKEAEDYIWAKTIFNPKNNQ